MKIKQYMPIVILILGCLVIFAGCQKSPPVQAVIPEYAATSQLGSSAITATMQQKREIVISRIKNDIVYVVVGEYVNDNHDVWFDYEMHYLNFKLAEDITGNYPDKMISIATTAAKHSWVPEKGKKYLLMLTEYRNVYEDGNRRQLAFPPIVLDDRGEIAGSTAGGAELLNSLKLQSKTELMSFVNQYLPEDLSQNISGSNFTTSNSLGDIVETSDAIVSVEITEEPPICINSRETFVCNILTVHKGNLTADKLRLIVPTDYIQNGEKYLVMISFTRRQINGEIISSEDKQGGVTVSASLAARTNSYFPLTDTEKVAEVLQLVEQLK